MKKLLLLALAAGFSANAFAQKPIKGSKGATAGLTAIAGFFDNKTSSSTGSLIFKYYATDRLVPRLAFNYASVAGAGTTFTDTTTLGGIPSGVQAGNGYSTSTVKVSGGAFNLEAGAQYGLGNEAKFEPYLGGAFMLGLGGNRVQSDQIDYLKDFGSFKTNDYTQKITTENLGNSYGFKGFMGINAFLIKNMAIGAEFGWGYNVRNFKGATVEYTEVKGGVETVKKSVELNNNSRKTGGFSTTGASITASFFF